MRVWTKQGIHPVPRLWQREKNRIIGGLVGHPCTRCLHPLRLSQPGTIMNLVNAEVQLFPVRLQEALPILRRPRMIGTMPQVTLDRSRIKVP